jgi:hypothetical protein
MVNICGGDQKGTKTGLIDSKKNVYETCLVTVEILPFLRVHSCCSGSAIARKHL